MGDPDVNRKTNLRPVLWAIVLAVGLTLALFLGLWIYDRSPSNATTGKPSIALPTTSGINTDLALLQAEPFELLAMLRAEENDGSLQYFLAAGLRCMRAARIVQGSYTLELQKVGQRQSGPLDLNRILGNTPTPDLLRGSFGYRSWSTDKIGAIECTRPGPIRKDVSWNWGSSTVGLGDLLPGDTLTITLELETSEGPKKASKTFETWNDGKLYEK